MDSDIEEDELMGSRLGPFLQRRLWIGISLAYALLVAAFHWEVVGHLGTKIIAGWQVGGLLVWECWWFQKSFLFDRALHPFFTPLLMFPSGVPISMHSPIYTLFCLLLAPFKNPMVTFNLYCLLGYVLRGTSMAALAYYVTKHHWGAFLAGLVFMFSTDNLTQNYLGHAGQANVCFEPIFMIGILMLVHEVRARAWALFVIGALGCALTTPYVGFHMLGICMPVTLAVLIFTNQVKVPKEVLIFRLATALVAVVAVGVAAYWPILLHRSEFLGGNQIYALKLRSFVLQPFWHRIKLWPDANAADTPEECMGYFPWVLLLLILFALKRKDLRQQRLWIALFIAGILLSVGSYLEIPKLGLTIPMPYGLLERLPFLGIFRAPARIIQLSWIGLAVLLAAGVKNLFSSMKSPAPKVAALSGIILVFLMEMDVLSVASRFTPLENGAAYRRIKSDPEPGAVFELPVAIDGSGSVSINAQLFMLNQPLHEKPLVLARPSRHTRSSLAFCMENDVAYELSHPQALVQLYERPELKLRREILLKKARTFLKTNSIKYIVFHTREGFFPPEIMAAYSRFLAEALGRPILVDEYGLALFPL